MFPTIKLRSTREGLVLFCYIQAFAVLSSCLFILYYMPDLLDEGDFLPEHDEEFAKAEENLGYENFDKILKERQKLSKGVTKEMRDGHSCVLFRYDTLLSHVDSPAVPMINEEEEFTYFLKEGEYMPKDIPEWFGTKKDFCAGCFVTYGLAKYLVALKDVTIYPKFSHGKVGGEDLEDVFLQTEEDEQIRLEAGYFVLHSNNFDQAELKVGNNLQKFVNGLLIMKESDLNALNAHKKQDMTAVVTARREYANIYHASMDWYDIFLIMVLFKIDPYHLEVIWLDAHPRSNLDSAWEILFGVPVRSGSLTDPMKYSNMIWNGFGHKSHINQHQVEYLPFVNEYRHFVLSRFEIPDDHVINCKELRITIIWRRHYIAHPRNPSGYTARRIANEKEVWNAVRNADVNAIVNGVQLDRLSMVEQLELMSRTDILIGMHGAGLSHILYLPKTSGVIELFPNYMSVANAHFRAMSKWRRLRHVVWANKDKGLEKKDHQTYIPKHVIQDLVNIMKENICESKTDL